MATAPVSPVSPTRVEHGPSGLKATAEDRSERRFDRIIGNSAALECVLDQVEQVAPTDSTVLIEGETGTGKELIAHAIHNASQRCGRPFIKLNCAAIPTDLQESELFGHERGAFTGAIAQKIGRFEMADRGTLFLDEVGDIPPELQPKVERAVILSRDGVLPNPLHKKQTEPMIPSLHRPRTFQSSMTLEDSDRALIVEMLEQVGWIVGGPRGAAAKLGLKRTTLLAKMRRLGISRPIHQEETDVLALAPAGIRPEDAQFLKFVPRKQ